MDMYAKVNLDVHVITLMIISRSYLGACTLRLSCDQYFSRHVLIDHSR